MKIIENKVFAFLGLPGSGKSIGMSTIGVIDYYFYGGSVYSNFVIKVNNIKISKDIYKITDITKLGYHENKGCLILDEWGINNSSRNSMSNVNKSFNEVLALGRKKNLDVLRGAQLNRQSDIIYREMSNYIFEMDKEIFWKENKIIFYLSVNSQKNGNRSYQSEYTCDFVELQQQFGISYSTLESSKIENDLKKTEKIELEIPE